eukprot:632473-Amorphochlora_amoeboformis.AAC.1
MCIKNLALLGSLCDTAVNHIPFRLPPPFPPSPSNIMAKEHPLSSPPNEGTPLMGPSKYTGGDEEFGGGLVAECGRLFAISAPMTLSQIT